MSKIYEALIRAEQERAEIDAARNQGASPSVLSTDPTSLETVPTGSLTQPRAFDQPMPVMPPVPTAPVTPGALFERITPTEWKPQLTHLPSLQDRGRGLEQFRTLRSHMLEFRDAESLKSILVSSGLPQEGKSFVAANLALSFARHKSARVLLIDGDMRRSSLHLLLGCSNEIGLGTYLSGQAKAEQVMQRAIVDPTDPAMQAFGSLAFIAGGSDGDHASDLSANTRFDELMQQVSPHFDWVIVDTSPVNLVADGVNLSRACDAVLLVVRGGVTKLETAQRALNELKSCKVLGVVLNAVEDLPSATGYYGYATYDNYDSLNR